MPHEMSPGKPTTRRYSPAEKDQAVRLVRQLRAELGTDHGTVKRVATELGIGVEESGFDFISCYGENSSLAPCRTLGVADNISSH